MYATGSITFVSHRTVSFFPLCSFFRRCGLDSAWEPMNGARPCVTSLAALVHMEGGSGGGREGGPERGGVGGVGGWVDGETLGGVQGGT